MQFSALPAARESHRPPTKRCSSCGTGQLTRWGTYPVAGEARDRFRCTSCNRTMSATNGHYLRALKSPTGAYECFFERAALLTPIHGVKSALLRARNDAGISESTSRRWVKAAVLGRPLPSMSDGNRRLPKRPRTVPPDHWDLLKSILALQRARIPAPHLTNDDRPSCLGQLLLDQSMDVWRAVLRARSMAALVQGSLRIPEWIDRMMPCDVERSGWMPQSAWTDAVLLAARPDLVLRHKLPSIDWDAPDANRWMGAVCSLQLREALRDTLLGTDELHRPDWRQDTHDEGQRCRWNPPAVEFGDTLTRLEVDRWVQDTLLCREVHEQAYVDANTTYWLGVFPDRVYVVVAFADRVIGAAHTKLVTGVDRPSWGMLDPDSRDELCGAHRGRPHLRITLRYRDRFRRLRLHRTSEAERKEADSPYCPWRRRPRGCAGSADASRATVLLI